MEYLRGLAAAVKPIHPGVGAAEERQECTTRERCEHRAHVICDLPPKVVDDAFAHMAEQRLGQGLRAQSSTGLTCSP